MGFESGTVSLRVCQLVQAMPEDALEKFAARAAGPLEKVKDEPQWGWVSGRHLLETRIDEQTAIAGGYLHLVLRQAQRKIPPSLLKAECRMVELSLMAETGGELLNRKRRRQIKQDVTERLLPTMPPQLSGTAFVVDEPYKKLYVTATSEKQFETFAAYFCQTVGFEPIALTPETLAMDLLDVDPAGIPSLNFSPGLPDSAVGGTLGQDFLTWLWYFLEQRNGVLPKTKLGEFGMMVDGPLVLVADGPGALESAIRKGMPTISAEAKAALTVGKKLQQAKLTLARGKADIWTANVNADAFTFRGVKLPDGEALDPGSVFQERVTNLYVLYTVFAELFKYYVAQVTDDQKLSKLQTAVKAWVRDMDGR